MDSLQGLLQRPEVADLVARLREGPWLAAALLTASSLLLWLLQLWFQRGAGGARTYLKPEEWQELPLASVQQVSHDTRRLRFNLPRATPVLGLPTGMHITLRLWDPEGNMILRPYTPVTDDFHRGHVDFVIKLYPDGRMSKALKGLSVGDSVGFKGPKGRFQYRPGSLKAIGMVAGGSGITPMFQVLQAICRDEADATPLSLVSCNKSESDILLRPELHALTRAHPSQFKVHYVVDAAPPGWGGSTGHCTAPLLKEQLPPPGEGVLILSCGPPPMVKAVDGLLAGLGYTEAMIFKF